MKLRVKKSIAKRIITVEIETTDFTSEENKMLDAMGEPVIKVEFVHNNEIIHVEKKIRTGFKAKVKFDGTENVALADLGVDRFIDKLEQIMELEMSSLKMVYEKIEDNKETYEKETVRDIDY